VLPWRSPDDGHAWHLYMLRIDSERTSVSRDDVIAALAKRQIGTSVHFIPVHRHAYYRDRYGYEPGDFPVADEAFQRLVSLPIYPAMSDRDVEDVVAAVRGALGGHDGG